MLGLFGPLPKANPFDDTRMQGFEEHRQPQPRARIGWARARRAGQPKVSLTSAQINLKTFVHSNA